MKRRVLVMAALALFVVGCNNKTITAIEIVPTEDSTVEVGGTLQFTVNATYDDESTGRIPEYDVEFSSSNDDVLTISGSGTAEGVKVGTADVSATREGLKSSVVTVTVVPSTEPPEADGGT